MIFELTLKFYIFAVFFRQFHLDDQNLNFPPSKVLSLLEKRKKNEEGVLILYHQVPKIRIFQLSWKECQYMLKTYLTIQMFKFDTKVIRPFNMLIIDICYSPINQVEKNRYILGNQYLHSSSSHFSFPSERRTYIFREILVNYKTLLTTQRSVGMRDKNN